LTIFLVGIVDLTLTVFFWLFFVGLWILPNIVFLMFAISHFYTKFITFADNSTLTYSTKESKYAVGHLMTLLDLSSPLSSFTVIFFLGRDGILLNLIFVI